MLSDTSRPLIEATIGPVAENLGVITPKFYERMFSRHPELLDGMFSRANQRNGTQQKALAGSIAAFASHLLENPDTLPEAVLSRIAHKHTSLGILEEHYPIVYENLFWAIKEVLGEAITEEVAAAWSEVYWLMADALIKIEKGLYAQQANDKIWTLWRVVAKENAGLSAMTFRLEPADDTPVTAGAPGQYVSVRVKVADGLRQARQYTLSESAESTTERVFTTKLDDGGEVSPVLHGSVEVGDVIELSNPYGDVVVDDSDTPLVLATAGIGCTPAASILQSLKARDSERQVMVLHAETEEPAWALKSQIVDSVAALPQAELHTWFESLEGSSQHLAPREGFMDLSHVQLPDNAQLYLCGPLPFMKSVRSQAIAQGVPPTQIHYEVFGPDLWLAA